MPRNYKPSDPYQILNVSPDADAQDIYTAKRDALLSVIPADTAHVNWHKLRQFKRICEACDRIDQYEKTSPIPKASLGSEIVDQREEGPHDFLKETFAYYIRHDQTSLAERRLFYYQANTYIKENPEALPLLADEIVDVTVKYYTDNEVGSLFHTLAQQPKFLRRRHLVQILSAIKTTRRIDKLSSLTKLADKVVQMKSDLLIGFDFSGFEKSRSTFFGDFISSLKARKKALSSGKGRPRRSTATHKMMGLSNG